MTCPSKSLERAKVGIEVVHVQAVDDVLHVTVFVPKGQEGFFDRKIQDYMTKLGPGGNPRHQNLIAGIQNVEAASLIGLWTGDPRHFPLSDQAVWWEVWIREAAEQPFRAMLKELHLDRSEEHLRFPERLVFLVRGTPEDIDRLRYSTGAIAELRRPQETPHFFVQLPPADQRDWSDDLLQRAALPAAQAPAVCILDTGVNREHPLLAPLLATDDWHAWGAGWPPGDNRLNHTAHGTAMAGLAAYGDLLGALVSAEPIQLTHRLESVRILPPRPTPNRPTLYGAVTTGAVGQAELAAPERRRAFCLAVTADQGDGRPTSWSAAIDDLAAGKLDDTRRLFVLSAGNVAGAENACDDYLYRCQQTRCPDPTPSWNSLVVGACTFLQQITSPGYEGWAPVASSGELSPYSTTSCDWDWKWPPRPDVVTEGGNLASSPNGTDWDIPDCFGVLTTHHDVMKRLFDIINATSAAAGQIAWMAGAAMAAFPNCWDETIRALIVHSAQWPDPVARKFKRAVRLSERASLLRTYGFGVPDIRRVLASASNNVNIVVENDMTMVDSDGKMPEMHFLELPWTGNLLRALGDTPVTMRVTLSYFVEANPAARGWKGRYRYASHGFRFHLQRPNESDSAFFGRLNLLDRDDDWDGLEGGEDGWFLGSQQRNRGSLHSDLWEGPAVMLADRRKLAIVPVGGWWKSGKSARRGRYSLVVSLSTPEAEVDLYTPIRTALATLARLPATIET
jgi:hypothetical protein